MYLWNGDCCAEREKHAVSCATGLDGPSKHMHGLSVCAVFAYIVLLTVACIDVLLGLHA